MSSNTCTRCGAEMIAGARFCRRCGEPAPHAPASSVLEAETRVFATQTEPASSTQHINSPLTGPAYMSPAEMPAPPAPVTKSLQPSSSATKVLLAGLVLILLIIPITLIVMKFLSSQNSRPETPVVTIPEVPPPAPPAPPSGRSGTSPISSSLIYPDAETVLDVTEKNGHVLQLRTRDPINKVVDWYVDKLKPDNIVKPGGNMTILRSQDIRAVITSTGNETSIIIKQGGDEE